MSKKAIPETFKAPTDLPRNEDQNQQWQLHNRSWWENNPMRYDWNQSISFPEFSKEFYAEIDKRFFSDAHTYMPWKTAPFDSLIPYDTLAEKKVLEIGVGNGSHAQLLAAHAKSFTGIDITDYAVDSSRKRMAHAGIANAVVLRMDAEALEFADNSFDFIWSWGVIHHSANTQKIVQEIARTLKPGGTSVLMVYHRSLWNYYIMGGIFHGLLQGDIFKTGSLHKTVQNYTDGGMARFYSVAEWKKMVSPLLSVQKIGIYGGKAELFPIPASPLKTAIMDCIPDSCTRYFTNTCGLGSFLVSMLKKR